MSLVSTTDPTIPLDTAFSAYNVKITRRVYVVYYRTYGTAYSSYFNMIVHCNCDCTSYITFPSLAEITNGVQLGASAGGGSSGFARYTATASSSDAKCFISVPNYTFTIVSTASTAHV